MARKSNIARDKKRLKMIDKYAERRAELKAAGDYDALHTLPRNSSPTRKKTDALKRVDHERICENSDSQESLSVNMRLKARYLASQRVAGRGLE